jgi:hypothetical protein
MSGYLQQRALSELRSGVGTSKVFTVSPVFIVKTARSALRSDRTDAFSNRWVATE